MKVLDDLQLYMIHEFVADYKDGFMSRRDMIRRVLYITGGVAATATILSSMGCGPSAAPSPTTAPAKPTEAPKPAPPVASPAAVASPSPSPAAAVPSPAAAPSPSPSPAAVAAPTAPRSPLSVPANDPAIETASITFPGADGAVIMAYQAKPTGAGPFPLVLICHENRGVTEHIEDMARRFAKEGYLAAAVDLLSREGGTAKADPAQVPALLTNAGADRHVSDFQAALRYLSGQPTVRQGAYAMTGYCFGGGIAWRTATKTPELKAVAPYYGGAPPTPDVAGIKAAMLGVYSSDPQDFANNGKDRLEAALKQAGVTYELKTYPNTFHGFNNDTGQRYNQEASLQAWKDVQDWFGRYVKA